ncbi:hypothetical protein PIB30_110564, partial [Stylosanthes scabra]|nr:hypothetical protein [Stylosanthes scabra]
TAEDDATSVKTTIENPLIIQQCLESTSLPKQPVIVLALEKAGEKESVAIPREPEKAEPTQRDLADSAEKKLERILKLRGELRELENAEIPQKPETSRTRIYNWATQCTQTNQYKFLFNFKTGKAYQAMRDHFMSLDREAEMDLV